jgi:hypothetical protein
MQGRWITSGFCAIVRLMPCARRNTGRLLRAIAALGVSLLPGCLPVDDPPLGQHVVADRTIAAAFFAASETPGVPSHLLLLGPPQPIAPWGVAGVDLYAAFYASPHAPAPGPTEGLAALSPTVTDVVLGNGVEPATYIPHTDSRGRLVFLTTANLTSDPAPRVARHDFATGQKQDLAPALAGNPGFLLSAKRTRVFAGTSVFELDSTTDLGALSAATPVFIGEDLYYGRLLSEGVLAGGSSINRSKPGAAFETLLSSTGMVKFLPIASDVGDELLISSMTAAGDVPFLLLNTKFLLSTSLPAQRGQAQFHSASGDGHYLLFRQPMAGGDNWLFVFDWTTNYHASSSSNGRPITADSEWRPGTHELWSGLSPTGIAVWDPDTGQTGGDLDSIPVQITFMPEGRKSMFTRDGSHWLSAKVTDVGDRSFATVCLGSADELTAPRQDLHPPGQNLYALWETSDGRLLVGASAFGVDRQDIYLVDPIAGTTRGIASDGHLVALGRTRALALLNWQTASSTGDLTLIDLSTGTKTTLAQDVYNVAIDPGTSADLAPDADRLAPGTAIAFLVRNRLTSPYDGLWLAYLP